MQYGICGQTVVTSLLATYSDPSLTPDEVTYAYYPYSTCGGTGISQSEAVLDQFGFEATTVLDNSWGVLPSPETNSQNEAIVKGYVNAGYDVMVGGWFTDPYGNEVPHYALAVGVDENGDLILNDPLYGANNNAADYTIQYVAAMIVAPPK